MKYKLLTTTVLIGLALLIAGGAIALTSCNQQPCIFLPIILKPGEPAPGATALPTTGPGKPTATLNPNPQVITGLAILGDSVQDEYRADNPRGGAYTRTTLNWVEQLADVRGINLGRRGTRPEPRRSGYAFNWARSGATSDQMISAGQHTGAAQEVLNGEVSHAIIQIGTNDFYFSGLGQEIYLGTISDTALQTQLNHISDNIITAAQTLKQTGHCQVMIAATQDYITIPIIPELQTAFQDPRGRQRFVDAIAYLNKRLAAQSVEEGVFFFDFNAAYLAEIQGRLNAEGFLMVGGEQIDLQKRGNEPHFGILDDEYVHPGTVLSGLYANVYARAMNEYFHTAIVPFSDDEILHTAGIKS
jgi:hypothetical protein